MNEWFELPVTYNAQPLLFPAQLQQTGYLHRFLVDVHGQEIEFEPDEEGSYRAVLKTETMPAQYKPDVALLQAIVQGLEALSA